jgi:hypothetical protein
MKKVVLHLCADIGSDSRFFDLDPDFEVIKVGAEIGVENFEYDGFVHGVIANPVCTTFSNVNQHRSTIDDKDGLYMVKHCLRIIGDVWPKWWVIENPANGSLRNYLGSPTATYQPWEYGSPWTKRTGLWGDFTMPKPIYKTWEDVPNKLNLWTRKGRKPSIVWWHKSAAPFIPEFEWAVDKIDSDMALRSMCSQGFARELYLANKDR